MSASVGSCKQPKSGSLGCGGTFSGEGLAENPTTVCTGNSSQNREVMSLNLFAGEQLDTHYNHDQIWQWKLPAILVHVSHAQRGRTGVAVRSWNWWSSSRPSLTGVASAGDKAAAVRVRHANTQASPWSWPESSISKGLVASTCPLSFASLTMTSSCKTLTSKCATHHGSSLQHQHKREHSSTNHWLKHDFILNATVLSAIIVLLAHENRTITIASDFRVDGATSPEILQKEGVLGPEIEARNHKSLATFYHTLKSQCIIAFSCLGNRCDFWGPR